MTIEQFVPRERTEGDSYKPSENVGRAIIVRVNEHKHIESTVHKPEGGPAVVCDVHDVAGNTTFRDVLWMNGAVVDELKGWLGRIVVIKFAWAQPSKVGGQAYISVLPAEPHEMAQAQARMNQGDPFAVQLQTTAPAPQPQYSPGGYTQQPIGQQQYTQPTVAAPPPYTPPTGDPWAPPPSQQYPGAQPPFPTDQPPF